MKDKFGNRRYEVPDQNKLNRREFIKDAAIAGAGLAAAGAVGACSTTPAPATTVPATAVPTKAPVPATAVPPTAVPATAVPTKAPAAATPWLPAKWDYEADVVIVGFGGGGTTAAITARDAGASVLVLEKAPTKDTWGGNTRSTGNFSIGCSKAGAIEYLTSQCWGTVPDKELITAHVEAVQGLPAWIAQLGRQVTWKKTAPNYPLLPGAAAFGGTVDQHGSFTVTDPKKEPTEPGTFDFFAGCAATRGVSPEAGTVLLATPATELIQDPISKEILGVKALTGVTTAKDFHYSGGKPIYVKAKKAVILACGGYENNEVMRQNYSPFPHSGFVTQYGSPFNTGDGITMAQRVGARLWHMNKKESHDFACVAASKELGSGVAVDAYGDKNADTPEIIVDRDGNRFMNEYFFSGHSHEHRAFDEFEHKRLPVDDIEYSDYRHVPMYWIFDDKRVKAGPLRTDAHWVDISKTYVGNWSQDNKAELAKGWFIQADTIEALAKKIVCKDFFGRVVGMNAEGLVATVKKYNQFCANGKDLDFNRRVSTLLPILTPPFYAMEICDCQTNTMGGPERNKFNQTLDTDGKPIPRLYNVGELGSIYGAVYNGSGNIPETYAGGKVAATHAVALKPWGAA
jgi:hypothetical protein